METTSTLNLSVLWTIQLLGLPPWSPCIVSPPPQFPSGWWYTYPSEKYEFVKWDDDIPNILWKNKNVPNHLPVVIINIPLLVIIIHIPWLSTIKHHYPLKNKKSSSHHEPASLLQPLEVWGSLCHHRRLQRSRADGRLLVPWSTCRPSLPPQDPLPQRPALRNLKSLKQGRAEVLVLVSMIQYDFTSWRVVVNNLLKTCSNMLKRMLRDCGPNWMGLCTHRICLNLFERILKHA